MGLFRLFVVWFCVVAAVVGQMSSTSTTYWHNYADENGYSQMTLCNLTNYVPTGYLNGPKNFFTLRMGDNATRDALFAVFPPGWSTIPHPNPTRQWFVVVQGSLRFSASGPQGPPFVDVGVCDTCESAFYFGDDLGAASTQGHLSYNPSSNVACIAIFTQFLPSWKSDMSGPCWPSKLLSGQ